MANPFGCRQRLVEDGEGAVGIAGAGFGFGERNLDEPVNDQNLLIAQQSRAATHVFEPVLGCARFRFSPIPPKKRGERPVQGEIMLARQPNEFGGVRRGAREDRRA